MFVDISIPAGGTLGPVEAGVNEVSDPIRLLYMSTDFVLFR